MDKAAEHLKNLDSKIRLVEAKEYRKMAKTVTVDAIDALRYSFDRHTHDVGSFTHDEVILVPKYVPIFRRGDKVTRPKDGTTDVWTVCKAIAAIVEIERNGFKKLVFEAHLEPADKKTAAAVATRTLCEM